MESRKVQQTGGSTYIISLPKKWAEKVRIKSGSQVFLQQHPDGTLVIDPVSESSPVQKKERDITGKMGEVLTRDIIAAYLAGFDIIELKSKRILAEQKNVIRDVCYKLIGPEIIEETSKSVIIQDLLNPNEVSIKKSVKRMFLISNSMHKDAIRALKTKDSDLAMDVIHRDDEVDRLFLLISKQFRAVLRGAQLPDTAETSIDEYHDFRMTASPLERIADHARKIAKVAYNMDFSITQDSMDLIENASDTSRKIVENSINALYDSNVELANQVIDQGDQMREQVTKINETLLKLDSHEAIVALGTVADSIDRIGDYGANIAEISINSAMSNALKEQD
ncbi:phosphate uptake regulator, PhoU [Methanohalobium evestigatum Z-7303]|uniref:Phosphate uptake regulator, PhoU n=1 Tax=Methanohalobium evestigatum (strain ATCC BAA-1072 / DSM 3721 / NBRC 107634 / OCM 161 / Z-7303) TaxID=644295 RepID=D7EB90_METEZ|nr:phosphate uptake regulator, PhoU [Methanohalobium evestigatum Z-7303]